MYNLIIFGAPGVGKGTQAKLISEKLNLAHFSTGDILRKEVEEQTELGLKAKEIIERGELVPDEIMIGIVRKALKNIKDKDGFILDGFPRTLPQAVALSELFDELNIRPVKIIYLEVNEDELVNRLIKRGRTDDTPEIIKKRFNIYIQTTSKILDYYKYKYDLFEINGVGGIDDINQSIFTMLTG